MGTPAALSPTPGQDSRPRTSFSAVSGSSAGGSRSLSLPALPPIAEAVAAPTKPRLADKLAKMRTIKGDPAAHLRRNPVQMGVPTQSESTYMAFVAEPISKASDPIWEEVRLSGIKTNKMLRYHNRIAIGGATLCPELHLC